MMRGKRILINPVDDYCNVNIKELLYNMKDFTVEYKMSAKMAKTYLDKRSAEEKKLHASQYLAKVVNEEYGLLRTCTGVTIDG